MPIPSDPIVVPPTEARTYEHQWILNLSVHTPSAEAGSFKIDLLPYDGGSGEIGPYPLRERIQSAELWRAAAEIPEFAAAMDAVFAAIPAIKKWLAEQVVPEEPAPEEPTEPPAP